jgi:hypothetical protein
MPAGILSILNNRDEEIAELFESWYLTEHLPERLGIPGFLAARRYEAVHASRRFLTYYDVESAAVLTSAAYLARVAAPSALTRQVMAHFRYMTRTVCTLAYRAGNACGGYAAVAYVEQPAMVDMNLLLSEARHFANDASAIGVQAWHAALDPAHGATTEAKLRPGGDRRIEAALIVDAMREADAVWLEERVAGALRRSVKGEIPKLESGVYKLLGVWEARKP